MIRDWPAGMTGRDETAGAAMYRKRRLEGRGQARGILKETFSLREGKDGRDIQKKVIFFTFLFFWPDPIDYDWMVLIVSVKSSTNSIPSCKFKLDIVMQKRILFNQSFGNLYYCCTLSLWLMSPCRRSWLSKQSFISSFSRFLS